MEKRRGKKPQRRMEPIKKRFERKDQKSLARNMQFLGRVFGITGDNFAERIVRVIQSGKGWSFTFEPHGKKIIFELSNLEKGLVFSIDGSPEAKKVVATAAVLKSRGSAEEQFKDAMQLKHEMDQMGWREFKKEMAEKMRRGVPELERKELAIEFMVPAEGDFRREYRIAWIRAMAKIVEASEKAAAK